METNTTENKYTKMFDNCLGVFQGGGCKAIAYIGAYKVAKQRGVMFSELAGTSAGAIIAAFIAAGATPSELEDIIYNIDFKKFTNTPLKVKALNILLHLVLLVLSPVVFFVILYKCSFNICKFINIISNYGLVNLFKGHGFYSTKALQDFIEEQLKQITGLSKEHILFEDLGPNLHIVAADIQTGLTTIWSKATPNQSVAEAVCASCAVPLFFKPVKSRYVDGGIVSNSPNFIFANKINYNKILSFKLTSDNDESKDNFFDYIGNLISTIINGAVSLQNQFGIEVYNVNIGVKDTSTLDFDKMSKEKIRQLITQGESATEIFFKQENEIPSIKVNTLNNHINSFDKLYSLVATFSLLNIKKVVISMPDTQWIWTLFPTALRWIDRQVEVIVYTRKFTKRLNKRGTSNNKENARKRLIQELGFVIKSQASLPLTGIFIYATNQWYGILYKEDESKHTFLDGCYYSNKIDSLAIEAWINKLNDSNAKSKNSNNKSIYYKFPGIKLIPTSCKNIIEKLKCSNIYTNASGKMELINISELYFLSSHVRLVKYRQIQELFLLYNENDLPLFDPVEIKFKTQNSIITPIVVEQHKDKLFVIEGKTRLLYAYNHGITTLNVLVLNNIQEPLPVPVDYKTIRINNLLITDEKDEINMEFEKRFRHIEELIHPSNTYLVPC